MAIEDLSAYSILDSNNRYTRGESFVIFTDLPATEDAYVYKDKTAAFFDGDFSHLLTVEATAATEDGRVYVWAITNVINDMKGIDDGGGSYLSVYIIGTSGVVHLVVEECDSGALTSDYYVGALNTPYYLKIVRDESAGTYGTLYCYIYTDSARTTLVDTISQTLKDPKKDYRYIFCGNTRNSGTGGRTISGYAENLELIGGSSSGNTPTVTTQECTNTIAQTSTGNGTLIGIGSSAVTAHGFCWNTTTNPTVSGGANYLAQVDLGAAPNLGPFSGPLTNLTPGTKYYIRAFATNTSGTAYGANVEIAGDVTTIGGRYWWVEKEDFHFIGESGTERKAQGVAAGSDSDILSYF